MLCNIKTKLNFQPAVSFLKENTETKNKKQKCIKTKTKNISAQIELSLYLRSRHKRVDVIMDIIQFYFASFYLSSKFDNSLRKFETFQCKKAAVNLHCKLLY